MSDEQRVNQYVRAYYQGQRLPPEKLQQLIGFAEKAQNARAQVEYIPAGWTQRLKFQRNVAVAASLLLASVISLQWLIATPTEQQFVGSIAQEIAINHRKQFAVEFSGNRYAQLARSMTKLDFTLVDPVRLKERGFEILGARYCSLQGQIAVQIRLKNRSGVTFTLYQTASEGLFEKLAEQVQLTDGLEIEMWNENGVFLGIAGWSKIISDR